MNFLFFCSFVAVLSKLQQNSNKTAKNNKTATKLQQNCKQKIVKILFFVYQSCNKTVKSTNQILQFCCRFIILCNKTATKLQHNCKTLIVFYYYFSCKYYYICDNVVACSRPNKCTCCRVGPKALCLRYSFGPTACGTAGSCAVTHGSVARWPKTCGSGVASGPGTTNTGNVGREEYCKVEQAK